MTFEDSPSIDAEPAETSKKINLDPRLIRRILWGGIGIWLIFLIGMVWLYFQSLPPKLPYGGLDGCLVSETGEPVMAEIHLANQTRQTYENGCFFFAALQPGQYQLEITTAAGDTWQQSVNILPGEAVLLGQLVISR